MLDGRFGGCLQHGEDALCGEGRDLCCYGQPAVHVALERQHVGGAGALASLARHFVHDVLGKEVLERGVEELVDAVLPYGGTVGLRL